MDGEFVQWTCPKDRKVKQRMLTACGGDRKLAAVRLRRQARAAACGNSKLGPDEIKSYVDRRRRVADELDPAFKRPGWEGDKH